MMRNFRVPQLYNVPTVIEYPTYHEGTMKLPRMTMRRWMVAVVLAALILCAARLLLISAAYRERANQYRVELLGSTPILMGPKERHSATQSRSAHSVCAESMAEKYLHASRFPWLPLEPDPPEP
jgi:hypothetical protein